MASVEHKVQVDKTPDEVRAVLGNYWGLADWFPGIERCEKTSDDVRTIYLGDLEINEQLLEHDEDDRRVVYTIASGPMPLEFHRAEWVVIEDGDGAVIVVTAEVRPDDAIEILGPVYEQAAQGLRDHVQG